MSNNTRITDLEPVDMSSNFIDSSFIEIVQNGDNKKITLGDLRRELLEEMYPVNSIYQTTSEDNPYYLLGIGNGPSSWVRYGYGYGKSSGTMTGAPAALYGYKPNDSNFTNSPVIRGLDSSAINDGAIIPKKHWGWKRLRISNFKPHTHETDKTESKWVWKYVRTEAGGVRSYDPNSPTGNSSNVEVASYEEVDSLEIPVRHGYGMLTSAPSVLEELIMDRDLGTTTTNIPADPRVDTIKIGNKNVKVDTSKCPFVKYGNTTYSYTTVPELKKSTNKNGTTKYEWDNTSNVTKWLQKQTIKTNSRGEIFIPKTTAGESSKFYSKYNPVANPQTKDGKVRIKANNSSGYTDITGFEIGDWVSYTDPEGVVGKIVYSKDLEVTEKTEKGTKKITVKTVNKWIQYHDVWQNRYWGRSDTNFTSAGSKINPKFNLIQEKNNIDPTGGYYGTELEDKVKHPKTAHTGDLASYKNKEFIYNPVPSNKVSLVSSKNGIDEYKIKNITQNEWKQDDSGVDAMKKYKVLVPGSNPPEYKYENIPEEQFDIGGETVRDMVVRVNDTTKGVTNIEVGRQSASKVWNTGGALKFVNSSSATSISYADYCLHLWPNEVVGFDTYTLGKYQAEFNLIRNEQDPVQAKMMIAALRAEIISDILDAAGKTQNIKSEYSPEYPANEDGTIDRDTKQSWDEHSVDNWSTVKRQQNLTEDKSHTVGTIVDTLPPYVTVNRWVRIS